MGVFSASIRNCNMTITEVIDGPECWVPNKEIYTKEIKLFRNTSSTAPEYVLPMFLMREIEDALYTEAKSKDTANNVSTMYIRSPMVCNSFIMVLEYDDHKYRYLLDIKEL